MGQLDLIICTNSVCHNVTAHLSMNNIIKKFVSENSIKVNIFTHAYDKNIGSYLCYRISTKNTEPALI